LRISDCGFCNEEEAAGSRQRRCWRLDVRGLRQKIGQRKCIAPPTSSEGEQVEPERSSNLRPSNPEKGKMDWNGEGKLEKEKGGEFPPSAW